MAPDDPTMPRRSVEASTGGSCRDDVKRAEANSSAPDDPTGTGAMRQSNEVSSKPKIPSAPDEPTHAG